MWLLTSFPESAPLVFVRPTSTMRIWPGRHVDANGKVKWEVSWEDPDYHIWRYTFLIWTSGQHLAQIWTASSASSQRASVLIRPLCDLRLLLPNWQTFTKTYKIESHVKFASSRMITTIVIKAASQSVSTCSATLVWICSTQNIVRLVEDPFRWAMFENFFKYMLCSLRTLLLKKRISSAVHDSRPQNFYLSLMSRDLLCQFLRLN